MCVVQKPNLLPISDLVIAVSALVCIVQDEDRCFLVLQVVLGIVIRGHKMVAAYRYHNIIMYSSYGDLPAEANILS
jgi:hypothetical protein